MLEATKMLIFLAKITFLFGLSDPNVCMTVFGWEKRSYYPSYVLGKEQESKLSEQADLIKNQADEMNRLNSSASDIEKFIQEKEMMIKKLDDEVARKNKTIEESLVTHRELTSQVRQQYLQNIMDNLFGSVRF